MQHGYRVDHVFAEDTEDTAAARQKGEHMRHPDHTLVFHFTARSGSSWLSAVLSRSGLGIGAEMFNPNFMPRMAERFGARTLLEYVTYGPRFTQRNRLCSFEITAHQMNAVFADHGDFHEAFASDHHFWLVREDIVAQAVSLQKMVDNGVAHSTAIDAEARRKADDAFEYNPRAIRKWLMHTLNAERVSEVFFAEFGVTPLRMSYERNIALGEEQLVKLLYAQIGLEELPAPPTAPEKNGHEKIGTDKNCDYAERFRMENEDFLAEIDAERQPMLAKLDAYKAA